MPTSQLPYITADLPGTGGEIKLEPGHFIVEEVPLYEPAGSGEHLFVSVTREERTTQEVVKALSQQLQVDAKTIGYAGLKDRQARTTQIFSIPGVTAADLKGLDEQLDIEIHWAEPHDRKLRPGHLLGNRFEIAVLHPSEEQAVEKATAVIAALRERGLPNFFGLQRFGKYGDNVEEGLAILLGEKRRPRQKWLHKLLCSAYQSKLFNHYLAARIESGLFDHILAGELAKKTDTGGMFLVEDVATDQSRLDAGAITYTGPLFGYKMRQPLAEAASFEQEIAATSPVTMEQWRRNRVEGNRRAARLYLKEVELIPNPVGFSLRFFLSKGAYATILLREIIKSPQAAHVPELSPNGVT